MAKNTQLHPAIQNIKYERTFCMIKPDGVMRGLIGEVIQRLEKAGLKVVALKMIYPTEAQVRAHYPASDEAWVRRLGEKTMRGFAELPDANAVEVLGSDDHDVLGKGVLENLIRYMQSGPVVCMVVEGIQAVAMVRKLAGHTLPFLADVGTIRGDFSVDSPAVSNAEKRAIHNLFHASETGQDAVKEIDLWFKGEPIHEYDLGNGPVMYDKTY